MDELLSYWNLTALPFETTWDTRFFFQSKDHDEALSRLSYSVEQQSALFCLVTGEVGSGKTLTRAVFAERLDPARFLVVTQENSAFAFKDLLAPVLERLETDGPGKGQTKFARYERLRQSCERLHGGGRHLVLIFDEAQEMSPATLNDMKLLTNLNGGGVNYLTIVLVGQPELRDRVRQLPAINQRIGLRFHLNSLTPEETARYLRHRVSAAGHPTGDVFSAEAIERMWQVARGVPRELNRLGKLTLEVACLKGRSQVEREAVDIIVRDFERQQEKAA
jgi:general secretion pathway protein A